MKKIYLSLLILLLFFPGPNLLFSQEMIKSSSEGEKIKNSLNGSEENKTVTPPITLPPVKIQELSENNSSSSLKGKWYFKAGDNRDWKMPKTKETDWVIIEVPGRIQEQGYKNFSGFAWYRLPIIFPVSSIYQNLTLRLGRIGDVDEVFLDGKLIGKTGSFPSRLNLNWKKERIYQIPAGFIQPKEIQFLTVRIYNHSGAGGFLDGPVEIALLKEATRIFFFSEIGQLIIAALIFAVSMIISLLFLNRPQEREALLLIIASFLYAVYLILNNNLLDLLSSNQLIRLKILSFTLLFLPLTIMAFFSFFWELAYKTSYWFFITLIIILFFIILLTSKYELILFLLGYVYPFLISYSILELFLILFQQRKKRKNEVRIISFTLALNLLIAINDYMKFQGFWFLPELSPVGFCMFFIICAVLMEKRIVEHHGSIESRNIELERALLEKTSERNLRQVQLRRDTLISTKIKGKLLEKMEFNAQGFKGELFSKPVSSIGKDYFNIMPVVGGKYLIFYSDLSLTGTSASLMASWLHINLEKITKKRMPINKLFQEISKLYMFKKLKNSKPFPIFLALLEPKKKSFQFINFGLHAPLLIEGKNNKIIEIKNEPSDNTPGKSSKDPKNPQIKIKGMIKEINTEIIELIMQKGERFVFYSEGISISSSLTEYTQFGGKRISYFFQATKNIPLPDLGEIFFTELGTFLEGKKQQHDWSFFAMDLN